MAHATRPTPAERWAWVVAAAAATDDACRDWPWGKFFGEYGALAVEGRTRRVNILVCELTHGPRPAGMQAAHSCGRAICCSGAHLRWATPKENQADRIGHGTVPRGERNGLAKLTEAKVRSMRIQFEAGGVTGLELAAEYGVSESAVHKAVRRESWKHVP